MSETDNNLTSNNPEDELTPESAQNSIQDEIEEEHPSSEPPIDASSKEYQQKMFEERHGLFMNEFSQLMKKHDIRVGFAYIYDHTLKTPLVCEKGHPADLLKEVTQLKKFFQSNFDMWINDSN